MLRGALIGVGHVARNGHLPGWAGRGDATLVAAADGLPDGRDALLSAFPSARWYAAAGSLLENETPDFVDVCTPPAQHVPIVQAALEAGCHVLCEKPLVLSPADVAPLSALSRSKDRALVTVHNWKHAPALAKVTELVASGAVGRVRCIRWETLRREPAAAAGDRGNWRVDPAQSGGGILVDHGWHAFYVLLEWLGGAPRAVSARLETRKHREHPIEDTATVTLDWAGASVEVFLTWAAAERANRVEIEGDRGHLRLDGGSLELAAGEGPVQAWSLPSIAEGSHHPEWFLGVVDEFLREIADPAARGRNLEAAGLCAELLGRAAESHARGGASLPVSGR